MTEKYKILARFIKEFHETPTSKHIFVKDYISKYNFNIDINLLQKIKLLC